VLRHRVEALSALDGGTLDIGGARLGLAGPVVVRELLPYRTLYAHVVESADADELAFLRGVEAELDSLGVACRSICGRLQQFAGGASRGFGLMLDGLDAADALRVLEHGLGAHRLWGCGLFVPHRSAAAVGS